MLDKLRKTDLKKVGFFVLLAAVLGGTYALSPTAAAAQLGLLILIVLFFLIIDIRRRAGLNYYFNKSSNMLSLVLRESLADLKVPTLAVSPDGKIAWHNEAASLAAGSKDLFGRPADDFVENYAALAENRALFTTGIIVNLRGADGIYRMHGSLVRGKDKKGELLLLYFVNITDMVITEEKYRLSRPVVALIQLDNLEELAQSQRRGSGGLVTLTAAAEKTIGEWAAGGSGLLRRYETGKYVCVFESSALEQYKRDRFMLLDQIRKLSINKTSLTLSMGLGCEGDSFAQNYDFASQALDMALGRGGDQAVIKNKNNFEFFGGRSKTVEKRTKVKSRILAEELAALMDAADNVLVMGHKYADFDAMGAAVGIARIAMVRGRPVNIVCNRSTSLAGSVVFRLEQLPEYNGVFVDPGTALDLLKLKTLLVICDVHSPSILEAPEIYKNAGTVAVIDHHRKMADYIDNAAMSYHEPYASSTCELVTELVQYIDGEDTLLKDEAEAMLAGIVLDTKNFSFKTGFRTFEAAAHLRRAGADTVEVKKLFQNDFDSYVKRNELIQDAEFYRGKIAISCRDNGPFPDAKTITAQAADELLSIEGVEASFVLYTADGETSISARSLGTVNVQLILEKLGGGGHHTTAGAQVAASCADTRERVIKAIDEYLSEAGLTF